MTTRDHWIENLRCPQCGKTGAAELSMADSRSWTVRPDSVPAGFKVVESENSGNFYCAFCDRHGCGKITRRAKFRLTRRANHFYKFARLTRQEGRIAIVTKRGMGCGGRGGVVRAMGWQGGLHGP